MVTDYYPQEEGYIYEGSMIIPCKCNVAITAMSQVRMGGTTAGLLQISGPAAAGDSIGVALRAGGTGDYVPVAFDGIVKVTAGNTVVIQDCIVGGTTATIFLQYLDTDVKVIGGTAHIIGVALQAAATTGDEILVLLGRT